MKAVVCLSLVILFGCSNPGSTSDPVARAVEIERARTKILEGKSTCAEVQQNFYAYNSSVFQERTYEKVFQYIERQADMLTVMNGVAVTTSKNLALRDRFCELLLERDLREMAAAARHTGRDAHCPIDSVGIDNYSQQDFNAFIIGASQNLVAAMPDTACKEIWAAYWNLHRPHQ